MPLNVAVPYLRRSATVLVACAVALGFTASADARSKSKSATLDTDGTIAAAGLKYTTEGYALATMTVSFPSKERFSIYGVVRDVCPKDGNGAYVDVETYIPGPAGAYFSTVGTLGRDTNGCGGSSEQFAWSSKKIRYLAGVRVRVCERDADGGEHAYRKTACSQFHSFPNPRR